MSENAEDIAATIAEAIEAEVAVKEEQQNEILEEALEDAKEKIEEQQEITAQIIAATHDTEIARRVSEIETKGDNTWQDVQNQAQQLTVLATKVETLLSLVSILPQQKQELTSSNVTEAVSVSPELSENTAAVEAPSVPLESPPRKRRWI